MEDFEIHIADNNISSGSINISWCLSKSYLEILKNGADPCVVIITAPIPKDGHNHDSRKERRKVVRVKDLLAYVDFSSPGANRIFAFILYDYSSAKKTYLSRSGYDWEAAVVDYECENVSPPFYARNAKTAAPIDVVVPDNLFAKKPSQWEQDWVHWLSPRDKAIDQCDFRRKRLFAYTIQPFILLISLIARTIVLFGAVLFLNRGTIDMLKALIHPLQIDFNTYTGLWTRSLFTYAKQIPTNIRQLGEDGNEITFYTDRVYYRYMLLTPGGILISFSMVSFIMFVYHKITNWSLFFMITGIIVGIIALCFGLIIMNMLMKESAKSPISDEDIDLLICSENKIKSINDVTKKSIRLRYDDLKNKVCKPFSM